MQRKPTKQSRGPNADEKRFVGMVKELPCIVCDAPGPSIVDHIYGSSKKVMLGVERVHIGHMAVLPLCYCCDQVKTNGSRRAFEETFGEQETLFFQMLDKHNLREHVPKKIQEAIAGEAIPW